jgi:hypothetical protein
MVSTTHGTLLSWYTNRGFGVLQGPTSLIERYFLHVSQIAQSPDFQPKVGMQFSFNVAPPRKEGELPRAVFAKLVAAPAVQAVL